MLPQLLTIDQPENETRQQKRNRERCYQKALKKLKKLVAGVNLPVTFDNTTVTQFGNFGLFEALKQVIGFVDLLREHLTIKRHHNCRYSAAEIIEIMIDCAALGLLRFSHMNTLKSDNGYKTFKGITQVPDESTLRNLLASLTPEHIEQLRSVNEAVLVLKADFDGPREVWLDFDDSVITVFGTQEGAEVGYNPRYHGRQSYKVKVAFVSGTGELVNAWLSGGRTASNGGFFRLSQRNLSQNQPKKNRRQGNPDR